MRSRSLILEEGQKRGEMERLVTKTPEQANGGNCLIYSYGYALSLKQKEILV